MNKLNFDILYLILNKLDFLSKIRLRCISKYMHKLEIHDFYNIPYKYLRLLNDEILLNYPFIKYLYAFDNHTITNINHMNGLTKLDASLNFGIDNFGIKNVDSITILYISGNEKITDVNHMNKLVELYASGESGIENKGIINLKNITKLYVPNNQKNL
jgi:hypothetical protein